MTGRLASLGMWPAELRHSVVRVILEKETDEAKVGVGTRSLLSSFRKIPSFLNKVWNALLLSITCSVVLSPSRVYKHSPEDERGGRTSTQAHVVAPKGK